ncbi:hypothetical protein J2S53_002160 [Actinopolyspora lacussalsi]|nr:hypothetical protein [Actinopolyspora lacussalsi]
MGTTADIPPQPRITARVPAVHTAEVTGADGYARLLTE